MQTKLQEFDKAVVAMLLAGDDPVLQVLREQVRLVANVRRELSGAGFFAYFELPREAPRIEGSPSFQIGDLCADVERLEYGAGFVLFVRNGAIDVLEGFSYEEPWPDQIGTYTLKYTTGLRRDLSALRALPGWPDGTLSDEEQGK
jgi:hypothetical protein